MTLVKLRYRIHVEDVKLSSNFSRLHPSSAKSDQKGRRTHVLVVMLQILTTRPPGWGDGILIRIKSISKGYSLFPTLPNVLQKGFSVPMTYYLSQTHRLHGGSGSALQPQKMIY